MTNEFISKPENFKQMLQKADDNMYARLLKEQGCYVIRVGDVDWHDYGGFMVPAYLPHCCPDISEEIARQVVRISGRPFARWADRYGMQEKSEWWYILRKGIWSLEQCSGNTRSKIRRGYKRLESRPISPAEVLTSGYEVCVKAVSRYGSKEFLPSRDVFERKIKAAMTVPGVLEFFGVFSGSRLVGYSENYIQDYAVFWESIWYDPAFLSNYSSYVLTAEMLKHYLNERHFKYALDGCRSIYHKSEVQEYFIRKFGFTKQYAVLNVVYSPKFAMAVKAAYPFRGAIWALAGVWQNSTLDKVSGVLKQEQIAKACEKLKKKERHLNIVVLTNDNFFSFTALEDFLGNRKEDIKLMVFSSALIGKRGTFPSIFWSMHYTGFRHTFFKLLVYGVFRALGIICRIFPFIPNRYSSYLWAKRNGIESVRSRNINSPEMMEKIKSAEPDLIVSVSMNQILKKQLLNLPPKRCINVHCAPLPRYAGMSPYVWTLANKEEFSGVTIHYMEEGLDEGDILIQEKEPILKEDTAFCLFYRCCLQAASLLTKVVRQIETDNVHPYQQDLSKKTYFSWPDRHSIKMLRKNGYSLARFKDFFLAVFKHKPRLERTVSAAQQLSPSSK